MMTQHTNLKPLAVKLKTMICSNKSLKDYYISWFYLFKFWQYHWLKISNLADFLNCMWARCWCGLTISRLLGEACSVPMSVGQSCTIPLRSPSLTLCNSASTSRAHRGYTSVYLPVFSFSVSFAYWKKENHTSQASVDSSRTPGQSLLLSCPSSCF